MSADAKRLYVFLPARRAPHGAAQRAPLGPATVVGFLAPGAEPASGDTPITLLPKADAVDLVLDCADVFLAAVAAPRMSGTRLRQALPNLVEDRLLADAADTHYVSAAALEAVGGAAPLAIAAIDRGLLTRALDALAQAGLRPRAAYNELFVLPPPSEGTLSVRADRGRGVARTGLYEGVGFDLDGEAPAALLLAIARLRARRLRAYGREAAKLVALAPALGVEVEDARAEVDADAVESAVNLLQGPFAPAGRLSFIGVAAGALLRQDRWRPLAAWTAACAAVYVAGLNFYHLRLQADDAALRAGMRTAFANAFPNQRAIVSPEQQAERELGALRARAGVPSPDDFSVLNSQALQVLAVAPMGLLAGVDYRDRALRLKFKPSAIDSPALQNTLRARAMQLGLDLHVDADGGARLAPAGPAVAGTAYSGGRTERRP